MTKPWDSLSCQAHAHIFLEKQSHSFKKKITHDMNNIF